MSSFNSSHLKVKCWVDLKLFWWLSNIIRSLVGLNKELIVFMIDKLQKNHIFSKSIEWIGLRKFYAHSEQIKSFLDDCFSDATKQIPSAKRIPWGIEISCVKCVDQGTWIQHENIVMLSQTKRVLKLGEIVWRSK